MKKLASATDPLWYKDAIIYELHVRAFADSNNDGIGDFPGLMSRLDYLQDLGVTCLWILPFFPSPLRDDGYDIASYNDVNPSYGTLSDFKAFLDAAHKRGLQVMIELVINHTSDQHPWFKRARLAPPGSPERDMYVWSDTDQKFKDARIIFTDTEKSNWTWDDTAKAFYWHRFFSHQPDLNYDSPLVMEEMLKAMRFWLDMGVDALRLDAIPYLVERDGTNCENLPETHAAVKKLRAAIDESYANRLILAEANQWPADVRPYFGEGDECHMAFHFPLMPRIYMALRQEDRLPITDIMAQTPPIPDNCQWGLFLRNHDELTLEMVTDDERDYMYLAYSTDPRMRVNVGIRRRLAPLVDNNRRRIELLNSILFSFPGTPILYYGDEIGMGDNIYLGDRNGVRTPMQWTSDRNAGFSKCDPARLYFPVIMDPIYGYQVVNVEAQQSDQSSLLHWTRNMIALRKLFQVFGRGSLTFLNPVNRKILAYMRAMDMGDGTQETVLCVANLSRFAQPVELDLSAYAGMEPVEMLGYVPFPTIGTTPYALAIAPYSFLWLELQPAAPKAEQLPETDLQEPVEADEPAALDLLTKGWAGFLAGHGMELLERVLPEWLGRQRWFGAKTRTIVGTRLLDWVELPAAVAANAEILPASELPEDSSIPAALCIFEVDYGNNDCDVYQVPLAFTTGAGGEGIEADRPVSVLARLRTPTGFGVLHDATVREDTRQGLLRLIEHNAVLELGTRSSAAVLEHPERARHGTPQPGGVHLRPHEVFPAAEEDAPKANPAEAEDAAARSLAGQSVEPLPLTAQPGDAAAGPREDGPAGLGVPAQRRQPRESPSAGNPAERAGVLEARASTAFGPVRGSHYLPARTGSAEQSNTSIIFGNALILKLFRRLQAGENPDVEIGRFLTETAGFAHIAPFLGEISIRTSSGERTTIAMLQGLVKNEGDGWEWFLEQGTERQGLGIRDQGTERQGLGIRDQGTERQGLGIRDQGTERQGLGIRDQGSERQGTREQGDGSIEAAGVLGRRTAEMHLALATPTEDPAFRAEPFAAEDLTRDMLRIEEQATLALSALRARLATLPEDTVDDAAAVLARRKELLGRARAVGAAEPSGMRIRIHGDFHLGQTLRVAQALRVAQTLRTASGDGGDFVILDFEGEPARPLAERRRKQSPLKDVAGMIRSFSYAAWFGLDRYRLLHKEESEEVLRDRAREWEAAATAAFLRAYRETMAAREELLPRWEQAEALLSAYVLEKALYELLYELNNRPQWVRVPLAGILGL